MTAKPAIFVPKQGIEIVGTFNLFSPRRLVPQVCLAIGEQSRKRHSDITLGGVLIDGIEVLSRPSHWINWTRACIWLLSGFLFIVLGH